MWKARLPVILLGIVLVYIVYSFATIQPEDALIKNSQPAPTFAFKTKPGEPPLTKDSLKGKVILLDFWATWCAPCRQSIPELATLYNKYHEKGLEVIGISMDDELTRGKVPAVSKELGITYPVVYALDTPSIVKDYPADAIPSLYVIDRKGVLRRSIVGISLGMNLEEDVTKMLDEQQ